MAIKVLNLPLPLLTAHQNLLKNSCLKQSSTPHQTPFLFFCHDYHHLLHIYFRCAHPKNTPPQCLKNYMQNPNTYDEEPFDFIFNQWSVFSGIVDWNFHEPFWFCLWGKKKTRKHLRVCIIYSMFKDIISSVLFLDHLNILKILCCFLWHVAWCVDFDLKRK